MKLIITTDPLGKDFVLLYPPELALRAIALGDDQGYCPDRRMASKYIPPGEVWYTQDPSTNAMFDILMRNSMEILEEVLD